MRNTGTSTAPDLRRTGRKPRPVHRRRSGATIREAGGSGSRKVVRYQLGPAGNTLNNLVFSQPKPDGSLRWLIDRSPRIGSWKIFHIKWRALAPGNRGEATARRLDDSDGSKIGLHDRDRQTTSNNVSGIPKSPSEMTVLAMGVTPAAQRSTERSTQEQSRRSFGASGCNV